LKNRGSHKVLLTVRGAIKRHEKEMSTVVGQRGGNVGLNSVGYMASNGAGRQKRRSRYRPTSNGQLDTTNAQPSNNFSMWRPKVVGGACAYLKGTGTGKGTLDSSEPLRAILLDLQDGPAINGNGHS